MNNNYKHDCQTPYDTCECPDIDTRIRRFEKHSACIDPSYMREYSLEGINRFLYHCG